MRLTIRFDSWQGDHIRCTVFANGANCGQLTMRVQEYQAFVALILLGERVVGGQVRVESDDRGFREKALEGARVKDGETTVEASPRVYADMLLRRGKGK